MWDGVGHYDNMPCDLFGDLRIILVQYCVSSGRLDVWKVMLWLRVVVEVVAMVREPFCGDVLASMTYMISTSCASTLFVSAVQCFQ